MVYPTIEFTDDSSAHEHFLLRVYPCIYSRFSLCLITIATSLGAILFVLRTCSGNSSLECSPSLIRWAVLIPLGFFLAILHYRFNNAYELDNTNICRQEGRLSFRFRCPSVRYDDIRGITVHQSFWGRILDYGSIELGTSATGKMELMIEDVRAPNELADLIEILRRKNLVLED